MTEIKTVEGWIQLADIKTTDDYVRLLELGLKTMVGIACARAPGRKKRLEAVYAYLVNLMQVTRPKNTAASIHPAIHAAVMDLAEGRRVRISALESQLETLQVNTNTAIDESAQLAETLIGVLGQLGVAPCWPDGIRRSTSDILHCVGEAINRARLFGLNIGCDELGRLRAERDRLQAALDERAAVPGDI